MGVTIDPAMFKEEEKPQPVYNQDGTVQKYVPKFEFKFPIKPQRKESKPLNFKCQAGSKGELTLIFNQYLTPSRKFKRRKLGFVDSLTKVVEIKYNKAEATKDASR